MNMNITIYTTPTCGYCHQVKRFLTQRGVNYTEYDVSLDQSAAREMLRLTGQMGVPVIAVDDQVVIGFDRKRLEQLLNGKATKQRPRLGLKVADASKIAQKVGDVPTLGALVGDVAPSSHGESAGIRKGDIITEVNMRPIRNAGDLENVFANLTSGSKVTIVFLRDSETLKSEIVWK